MNSTLFHLSLLQENTKEQNNFNTIKYETPYMLTNLKINNMKVKKSFFLYETK